MSAKPQPTPTIPFVQPEPVTPTDSEPPSPSITQTVRAETLAPVGVQFFEPILEPHANNYPVSEPWALQMESLLCEHRLLLLGDCPEIDKAALARHLAWRLQRFPPKDLAPLDSQAPVRQWNPGADPVNLLGAIRSTTSPTIFLFHDVHPNDVGFDLTPLQDAALANHHYLILSTRTPLLAWHLPIPLPAFCPMWSPQHVFSQERLVEYLVEQLGESIHRLVPNGFEDQPLAKHPTIRLIAPQLETPENIALFVQLLGHQQGDFHPDEIPQLVRIIQTDRNSLHHWYHHLLDDREKLLALGLSIFDGLFDDQLFSALEELVERVWKKRDASLRSLDYCDLDNLSTFFTKVHTHASCERIEARLPGQRRLLFEAAWNSQRRQLMAILPTLVEMVQASVGDPHANWELFGTPARRDQLRRAIGESLSDLGTISLGAVQDSLLRLAADPHPGVQAVAARALARWREKDHDTALFAMLENWRTNARIVDILRAILTGTKRRSEGPHAYILATLALTLGYAAQYDTPDHCAAELVNLLEYLSEQTSPMVRDRLYFQTLPTIVPTHTEQLCPFLRQLIAKSETPAETARAIARSVGLAYRNKPNEVQTILTEWYREGVTARPRFVHRHKIGDRETLLAAVAMTYGEVRREDIGGTEAELFRYLHRLLKNERHRFVRDAVVAAISRQAERDFDAFEEPLQILLGEVTDRERQMVVENLTAIYLQQRRELDGGDAELLLQGRLYPVWLSGPRPETAMEKTLHRWIKDAKRPAAQRAAMETLLRCAKDLEMREENFKVEERDRRRKEAEARQATNLHVERTVAVDPKSLPKKRGYYIDTLVPFLATFWSWGNRPIIQGLLSQALDHRDHNEENDVVAFLLDRWRNEKDPELHRIAEQLTYALHLVDIRWKVVGTAYLAATLAGGGAIAYVLNKLGLWTF